MLTDSGGRSIVPFICVLSFDPLVLLFGMGLVLSPLLSSFHTSRFNSSQTWPQRFPAVPPTNLRRTTMMSTTTEQMTTIEQTEQMIISHEVARRQSRRSRRSRHSRQLMTKTPVSILAARRRKQLH